MEEPPLEEGPAASSVPTVEAAAPAAPRSEPVEPAGNRDRDRDRDQQGRRGRRRRNRGRGFPESKYASGAEAITPPPPSARETAAESASLTSAAGEDFLVLPGETLAKYQEPGIAALDPDEEDEIAAAQAEADARTGGDLRVSAIEEAEAEAEPIDAPALLDEPEPIDSVPESVAFVTAEQVAEAVAEDEAAEEAEEAEEVAAELAAELVEIAEAGESETVATAEPGAASATGEDAPPANASASVRERGGRYPHRASRRTRRKMRGGQPEARENREATRETSGRETPAREAPSRETSAREAPATVTAPAPAPTRPEPRAARPAEKEQPSITELLKEGQEIIVQIAKEPLGQKGARITSHIALPGRYVVYMPTVEHMGVSRKIGSDEERLRLKRILQAHRAGIPGGYIMRTAGEGKSEEEIASDMNFLYNLWTDIRQKAEKKHAPALLHHDLDIVQRLLRDQLTENFKAIWVDNEDLYESVLNFVQRFQPALVPRVKMYTRPAPIFEAFSITSELEKALRPKVWLKSGGYIVLNQTEALVAIDVNTGKTNTDAVKEIVRQIRLRDLGGIIVVDFIDMDERKNRQKVMQTLEEAMRADRAPYKILQFNDFGLVAITRKRVKQSLERTLCAPCPYCEGAGYVKSPTTTISEILLEAQKIVKAVEGEEVILRVNPEVAKLLNSHTTKYLEELESILRRPVLVKSDPLLHQEKFDLA
jgi:ribonuclease G